MKYKSALSIVVSLSFWALSCNNTYSMDEFEYVPAAASTTSGFQTSRFNSHSGYTSATKLFKRKVSNLVSDLMMNMRTSETQGNIIVTNFLRTTQTDNSNVDSEPLSYQLAEEFTNQLHRTGFHVIDFKITDSVRVTPKGDFMLSRDYIELNNNIDAQYVLVGSYDINSDGVIVYSRVVDIQSKAVLATSSTLLEHYTVNSWLY
ncbi:hypothetical protein J3L16_01720 [Alteromonas sp. 5E99-2]|uniref:FlgO family outer membrane protein n=1 Tax=Alteromonas sp. 5E99-2 TaxID=2817683 RepID=UPI001A98702E|nr:FlgO family outer membrane protein [Alteromonas sp. 5E99-2]MBO1254398.1 hypothetical protein [Alteromonas sp. 5E99-2]